jgi:hypothetical protein
MVYRRNKYIGTRSCYASEEGAYVPGRGLTEETFFTVLALILREQRGAGAMTTGATGYRFPRTTRYRESSGAGH